MREPPGGGSAALRPGQKTWTVGTLTYTRWQLAQVFTWLLLGDFCLHLMDMGVVPYMVPVQLEKLGASKTLINVINLGVINLMFFVLVPIVSVWSDRTRTRIGRRRPFLLFATPPLALTLVLLGFGTNIARWLGTVIPGMNDTASVATLALGITIGLYIVFKFFDMFPQSVYYYMWPDVIPPQLMGMFGALFRVFYSLGSLVFNKFLIGIADEHPEEIYIGAAVAYMVAFLLLVWRVKEPEYPPPPPMGERRGFWAQAKLYFVECFSHAFYVKYFLAMAAFQVGYQPFFANIVFFGRQVFGTDKQSIAAYGNVMALKDFIWIGIYLLLVPVMLRLHPVKAGVVGYLLMLGSALGGAMFIHDQMTFRIFVVATFAAVGLYLGGTAAIGPRLLPREKYGQFASAGAMVFRLSVALIGPLIGVVIDWFGPRYVFVWFATFLAIGSALMLSLYVDWRRLGGETGYVPPGEAPPDPAAAGPTR